MSNKSYLPLIVAILISSFVVLNFTGAVTTTNLKNTTVVTKYRLTYSDIVSATDTTYGSLTSCKKLTLYTMQPEDQILSLVSIVTTPFNLTDPNQNDKIITASIRPERNGEIIQGGGDNIGNPPELTPDNVPNLENTRSNLHAFYGDTETTDVVMTFCNSSGAASLDDLYQGEVDFYINKIATP